jgi:hypothetical protein
MSKFDHFTKEARRRTVKKIQRQLESYEREVRIGMEIHSPETHEALVQMVKQAQAAYAETGGVLNESR